MGLLFLSCVDRNRAAPITLMELANVSTRTTLTYDGDPSLGDQTAQDAGTVAGLRVHTLVRDQTQSGIASLDETHPRRLATNGRYVWRADGAWL